jgi:hypothetical protein
MKIGLVQRRTFEALKWAKGSPMRIALNKNALTSEYLPSYKYLYSVFDDGHKISSESFRTKAEAMAAKEADEREQG